MPLFGASALRRKPGAEAGLSRFQCITFARFHYGRCGALNRRPLHARCPSRCRLHFEFLPPVFCALPSVSSLLSPVALPATSFTLPFACSIEPLMHLYPYLSLALWWWICLVRDREDNDASPETFRHGANQSSAALSPPPISCAFPYPDRIGSWCPCPSRACACRLALRPRRSDLSFILALFRLFLRRAAGRLRRFLLARILRKHGSAAGKQKIAAAGIKSFLIVASS